MTLMKPQKLIFCPHFDSSSSHSSIWYIHILLQKVDRECGNKYTTNAGGGGRRWVFSLPQLISTPAADGFYVWTDFHGGGQKGTHGCGCTHFRVRAVGWLLVFCPARQFNGRARDGEEQFFATTAFFHHRRRRVCLMTYNLQSLNECDRLDQQQTCWQQRESSVAAVVMTKWWGDCSRCWLS
jgi:hypothetical protein